MPMNEPSAQDGRPQNSCGSPDQKDNKAESAAADAGEVRQRLRFDGETSGMTPDSKRRKETLRQDEVHESTAPPGESLEKKMVRFMTEVGAGGVHCGGTGRGLLVGRG